MPRSCKLDIMRVNSKSRERSSGVPDAFAGYTGITSVSIPMIGKTGADVSGFYEAQCSDVDEEDATFEICQTLTPDEGDKYCCFISYEVNGNKGRNCISMKQEEYEDRNGYITSLKEDDEQLKNLKAKIYCAGDKELPEDVGDDGENGGETMEIEKILMMEVCK